jgi:hypothetical protein
MFYGPLQDFPNYTVKPSGIGFIQDNDFFCSFRGEIINLKIMEERLSANYDKDKILKSGIYLITSTGTKAFIIKKQGVFFMKKIFEGEKIIWEGKEVENEEFIVKEEDILKQIKFGSMELVELIQYKESNKKHKELKQKQNRQKEKDKDQLNLF